MPDAFPAPLTFGQILAPMTEEAFFADVLGQKVVHVEGPDDRFQFAMNWDILTALLNQTGIWTPASLQLHLGGGHVNAADYAMPGMTRVGQPGEVVDLDKVRHWIRQGASIVLNEIHTLTPGLKAISKVMSDTLGGKARCNLYCSWREKQAFDVHFDTHDAYVLQIAGEKRWRIYQRTISDPVNHPDFRTLGQAFHEKNRGPLSAEFVVKPGDLVYLPRGFYHEALAQSDATMHVTFGVVPVIGLDLITAVYERAVHDELFRKAIPYADGDWKKTEQHIQRLAKRFADLVRDRDFQRRFGASMRDFRTPAQNIKLPDDAFPKK